MARAEVMRTTRPRPAFRALGRRTLFSRDVSGQVGYDRSTAGSTDKGFRSRPSSIGDLASEQVAISATYGRRVIIREGKYRRRRRARVGSIYGRSQRAGAVARPIGGAGSVRGFGFQELGPNDGSGQPPNDRRSDEKDDTTSYHDRGRDGRVEVEARTARQYGVALRRQPARFESRLRGDDCASGRSRRPALHQFGPLRADIAIRSARPANRNRGLVSRAGLLEATAAHPPQCTAAGSAPVRRKWTGSA